MLAGRALLIGLVVSGLVCGCQGPSPSPSPSPVSTRTFLVSLSGLPGREVGVRLIDTTGLVVAVTPSDGLPPLTADQYGQIQKSGIIARQSGGSQDLLIDWTTGPCNTDQTMTLTQSGALTITLDSGPVTTDCQLVLIGLSVRIQTSTPISPGIVHATKVIP